MSNFHIFGEGKVQLVRGDNGSGTMYVALSDLDEPHEMDVEPTAAEVGIPLHSTMMTFPTKVAFDRFMRIMGEFGETFQWKE